MNTSRTQLDTGDRARLPSAAESEPTRTNQRVSRINGHADATSANRDSSRRRLVVLGTPATIIEALAVALNAPDDLAVVGVASDAEAMFRVVERHKPDALVVYAPQMEKEIVETTARVKGVASNVRVVFLSEQPTVLMLAHAAAAGVAAYLPLDTGLWDLIEAIRADTTATMLVGASSLAARHPMTDRAVRAAASGTLTPRELEVLTLLAEGLTPTAIAKRLVVSIYTARGHVKNVLRKLDAHSQLEAVAIGTRVGLIPWRDAPASQVAR